MLKERDTWESGLSWPEPSQSYSIPAHGIQFVWPWIFKNKNRIPKFKKNYKKKCFFVFGTQKLIRFPQ